MTNERLERFEKGIQCERTQLYNHPVYTKLVDLRSIRVFMESHVFAVWDFMSLLKSLQIHLTCTRIPWTPRKNPQLARFINEIVLGEECDQIGELCISHYDLYLRAMKEVGADTAPITQFVHLMEEARDREIAPTSLLGGGGVFDFVRTTLEMAAGSVHEVAAAFLFGREDVIPEMFARILKELNLLHSDRFVSFRHYLERHIEVDGGDHGPLAKRMLISVCGDSEQRWVEAERAAMRAMRARVRLWYHIQQKICAAEKSVAGSRV